MITLTNVLYVPAMVKNLIFVSMLTSQSNLRVEFDNTQCLILDKLTHNIIAKGVLLQDLYEFTMQSSQTAAHLAHRMGCNPSYGGDKEVIGPEIDR